MQSLTRTRGWYCSHDGKAFPSQSRFSPRHTVSRSKPVLEHRSNFALQYRVTRSLNCPRLNHSQTIMIFMLVKPSLLWSNERT